MTDYKDIEELNRTAIEILRRNSREERYTVPAQKLYPFQWNWDSCFVAEGLATSSEDRAWTEIETLFRSQWESGKVPHIVFHKDAPSYFPGPDRWRCANTPPTSGITQPPVAATKVRAIYETAKDNDRADKALAYLIPRILKWHHWFHNERDPNGSGLIAAYHPWETGRDNSPEWDEPLKSVPLETLKPYTRRDTDLVPAAQRPVKEEYDRFVALLDLFVANNYIQKRLYDITPFKVADIGLNSILLRANRDLLWLVETTGHQGHHAEQIKDWIEAQEQALGQFWNDETECFHSLDLISGAPIPDITAAAFLPFYGGDLPEQFHEPLLKRFAAWAGKVEFMVPGFDPFNPKFHAERYWRGPVWPIMNYMIGNGLHDHGYGDQALRIGTDTARLIAAHGFMEYFNAYTAEGLGGHDFSWTASSWLCHANRYYAATL